MAVTELGREASQRSLVQEASEATRVLSQRLEGGILAVEVSRSIVGPESNWVLVKHFADLIADLVGGVGVYSVYVIR